MKKIIYILEPIQTNNFVDLGSKIIKQWSIFSSLEIKTDIKYGIYSNYKTDYKDSFDFSVGANIDFLNSMEIEIPDCKFQIFKGTQNEVFNMWKNIWNLENNKELNRAYLFDFEKYYIDGTVEIFVSIK